MPKNAKLLLLDSNVVQLALEEERVMAAVREAFGLHSQRAGRAFSVVREKLHTGGVFGIKSGGVASYDLLGFKAAGFWPVNRANGSEPHQATVALFDPQTGRPLCIMDGNPITTARTGAAGGLGLQLFARPESDRICVFGTGVQARVQLHYTLKLLPRRCTVQYVTSTAGADYPFEEFFRDRCTITLAKDRDSAVSESDVVITATPGAGALFQAEAVKAGTHLTCVGSDTVGKRELPEGILGRARIFVDDQSQARSIGECQWAQTLASTEIGDVLTGKASVARAPHDITVFDMTGVALQDLTVARYLYINATEKQLGTSIAWPW